MALQTHYRGQQSLDHGWNWQQSYQAGAPQYDAMADAAASPVTVAGRGCEAPWALPMDEPKMPSWSPGSVRGGGGYTTAMPPTPAQMKLLNLRGGKYGYYMDRGHGMVTRLIPADVLPPLHGIAAQEARRPDMDILPEALAPAPPGVADTNQRITFKEPTASTTMHNGQGRKKQKIYCDKWVHEGVCAFTQQGCRFKHEMPLDQETQKSLGLFHGLPAWYRKDQVERERQQQQQRRDSPTRYGGPSASPPRALEGSVPDTLPAPSQPVTPGHMRGRWRSDEGPPNGFRVNARRPAPIMNGPVSPFYHHRLGPIGPPRKLTQ